MGTFDYSRTPVNREAASVTSQSGCASDDTLTNEQKRQNLVAQVKIIAKEILLHPKKSKRRKELGLIACDLNIKINALRPKTKLPQVKDYIFEVIREELTPFRFKQIMEKVSQRARDKEGLEGFKH